MFKLEVLDHDDISLGNMIEKILKKEYCIVQNYKELKKGKNKKVKSYTSLSQLTTTISIDKKSFSPKRSFY